MYTGCDMNTTLDDMKLLAAQCDFVLAAIGNPAVDPNTCTAYGVLGALDAALLGAASEQGATMAGQVVVVHGCGNVGATVAEELAAAGATVYTVDLLARRAEVKGCVNISDGTPGSVQHPAWWKLPCDALVPCSKSGLFTADVAGEIQARFIVGATNLPFANAQAYAAATDRGAQYVPEGCTSAGAVIVDSVEHFDRNAFVASEPQSLYHFVRDVVAKKTTKLLEQPGTTQGGQGDGVKTSRRTPLEAVQHLMASGHRGPAIGAQFTPWLEAAAKAQAAAAAKPNLGPSPPTKPAQLQPKLQRAFSTAPDAEEAEEAALKHSPYGAEGAGYYSEATKGCYDVMDNAKPMVLEAVRRALASRQALCTAGTPFHVADFGTADAGTSMPLLRAVVRAVRLAEGPATPIVVCYEDQTTNDWNSVFKRVHGLLPGSDESFLSWGDDQVFALASGTSFYKPCFPARTLDVSFSATAMHWLSVTPQPIPDALHSACSQDGPAAAAFEQQAAQDWQRIMGLRAQELKPGGQLVLVNFAKDDDGQFLGKSARLPQSMHHTLAALWQGLVTPQEFEATNFPNQYRSLDATLAPFAPGRGALAATMATVSAKTAVVPCPYFDAYHRLGAFSAAGAPSYAFAGDAASHAANYVPTTRTWSNSTFLAGVSASRAPQEQAALVDALFGAYEQRVAAAPSDHAMDYVHAYVHFEKARS
jgi:hypothetical protein